MTPEQFERWKDFATRMAKTCFKGHRRPGPKFIIESVATFFDFLDEDDIPCIVDWDNSVPYAEGSRCYRRSYRTPCWHCSKRGSYSAKRADCPYSSCESGSIFDYAKPYCVGDMCSTMEENIVPGYWGLSDRYAEQVCDRWMSPLRCCVRAGLDFASAPSAGVVGFTAGHVRRMYPEGVPDWVFPPDERLKYFMSGAMNGTFAELPDSAGVVL